MNDLKKHSFVYLRFILSLILICFTLIDTNAKDDIDVKNIGVIAHRGYWVALEDSTQNSLAALDAAIEAGFYGSETDVWLTKDNVLVINHDSKIDDLVIENNNYSDIKGTKLSNGETLPTLEDFLLLLQKKSDFSTKLIIEIKALTKERLQKEVEEIIKLVSFYELQDKVEYISFWIDALIRVKEIEPKATCSYLGLDGDGTFGEELTPQQLFQYNINLDFLFDAYYRNPNWIEEAHQLGLTTNVWTVNTYEHIYDFMMRGIDFVTTNHPNLATEIKNEIEIKSVIDFQYDDNEGFFNYYDLNGNRIKITNIGTPIIRVNQNGKSNLIIKK